MNKLFAIPVIAALPIMPMQCGGNSPPTVGTSILRTNTHPDSTITFISGASGYVEGELFCTNNSGNVVAVPHGVKEVTYMKQTTLRNDGSKEYIMSCLYTHPYLAHGQWSVSVWAWD